MIRLTPEQLMLLAPSSVQRCREAFAHADDLLAEYDINGNALRLAHFMAQILHESGGLRIIEENLSYSAKRMMQVWLPIAAVASAFFTQTQGGATANRTVVQPPANIEPIFRGGPAAPPQTPPQQRPVQQRPAAPTPPPAPAPRAPNHIQ